MNVDGEPTQFRSIPAAAWFVIVSTSHFHLDFLLNATIFGCVVAMSFVLSPILTPGLRVVCVDRSHQ